VSGLDRFKIEVEFELSAPVKHRWRVTCEIFGACYVFHVIAPTEDAAKHQADKVVEKFIADMVAAKLLD